MSLNEAKMVGREFEPDLLLLVCYRAYVLYFENAFWFVYIFLKVWGWTRSMSLYFVYFGF